MVQMQSRLEVADNTGAKHVMMIRRLGQLTRFAHIGDITSGANLEHKKKRG